MPAQVFPVVFSCHSDELLGLIHKPEKPVKTGVLIVVGGPQYRVGSHRQFYFLAQSLAKNNIAAMRFDVRGMGDSAGDRRLFDVLDDDINSAINAFTQHCSNLTDIVIWGLCDAASAALFYAYQDQRVKGLVLLNPWAYTEQGSAKTLIKHYYLQRLFSFDLWKKVFFLKFNYHNSFASLSKMISKILGESMKNQKAVSYGEMKVDSNLSLPVRMRECFKLFQNPVLLILSGRDLTAKEFKDVIKNDDQWQKLIQDNRVSKQEFDDADHTFSSAVWRKQVENWTVDFIKQLNG